ncbi:MAG: hypothetical protein ABGZ23_04515 [Fuerstiella sp.]
MNNVHTLENLDVAITRDTPVYSSAAPYDPSEVYPEYPFGPEHKAETDNPAYRAVRDNFILLKMDEDNIGKAEWNPLGRSWDQVIPLLSSRTS